jgi:hypothetical protein
MPDTLFATESAANDDAYFPPFAKGTKRIGTVTLFSHKGPDTRGEADVVRLRSFGKVTGASALCVVFAVSAASDDWQIVCRLIPSLSITGAGCRDLVAVEQRCQKAPAFQNSSLALDVSYPRNADQNFPDLSDTCCISKARADSAGNCGFINIREYPRKAAT